MLGCWRQPYPAGDQSLTARRKMELSRDALYLRVVRWGRGGRRARVCGGGPSPRGRAGRRPAAGFRAFVF